MCSYFLFAVILNVNVKLNVTCMLKLKKIHDEGKNDILFTLLTNSLPLSCKTDFVAPYR